MVSGDLLIHGVTKTVTANGIIMIKDGKVTANAKFIVNVEDFKINIPRMEKDSIHETQEVTVSCIYEPKL